MDNLLIKEFGEIEQGKLHIYNKNQFLGRINDVGNRKITIEIKVREGAYTNQMRMYYFAVLVKQAQLAFWNAGYEYDLSTIDHTFRMKALYKETYDEENQCYIKEPHSLKDSDTEVTIKMFMYYIDYIIRFCAQNLDWPIMYPNEIMDKSKMTDTQANYLLSKK